MYRILAFYRFHQFDQQQVRSLHAMLEEAAAALELRGLLIISSEGVNATVAGNPECLSLLQEVLDRCPGMENMEYKESWSALQPFRRLRVDLRNEIVTFADPNLPMPPRRNNHLSPEEWRAQISSDAVLIDVRNEYEFAVGHFRGAINPRTDTFTEFREYLDQAQIPKDAKVLMYCTGGIRCEKAALEMQRRGYQQVFQLEGGILNYLAHLPDTAFEGECFVFDHRVALDQRLRPSRKYKLCPHCGSPAERRIACSKCGDAAVVCDSCSREPIKISCSKNCAHYLDTHRPAEMRLAVGS